MLDQVRGSQGELMDVRRKVAAMGPNFDPNILEATRARSSMSINPRCRQIAR
jgi:hypothetical protein